MCVFSSFWQVQTYGCRRLWAFHWCLLDRVFTGQQCKVNSLYDWKTFIIALLETFWVLFVFGIEWIHMIECAVKVAGPCFSINSSLMWKTAVYLSLPIGGFSGRKGYLWTNERTTSFQRKNSQAWSLPFIWSFLCGFEKNQKGQMLSSSGVLLESVMYYYCYIGIIIILR